ncbi:hypothetical protein AFK69_19400 [Xenorhabdus sp. GDc328]|nr:hypothetical protein AAY47_12055 [Xenorhabdus griffiniae]KOP31727.1 hypothetical protein AFK69_19400 [Xenorhabdus sp. GDc328]
MLLANANAVFAGNLLQRLHPFTFLFWSFLSCSLFFLGRLALQGREALAISGKVMVPLVVVNCTTALNWIGYYFALRFVEPAIVSAIMGGVGPLFMILMERFYFRRLFSALVWGAAFGVLAGTCLLVWASLFGHSGLKVYNYAGMLVGLSAALAGGASQALNTLATKQLGIRGWNAGQIMAHRFYLLILCALVLALQGPGLAVPLSWTLVGVVLSTLMGVIVPLWVLQRGILLSDPFIVAALLSLAPIIAYLFQGMDSRLSWSGVSLAGCLIVVVFTICSVVVKHKETRNEQA